MPIPSSTLFLYSQYWSIANSKIFILPKLTPFQLLTSKPQYIIYFYIIPYKFQFPIDKLQSDIFHHLISETVYFNASHRLCESLTMKESTSIFKRVLLEYPTRPKYKIFNTFSLYALSSLQLPLKYMIWEPSPKYVPVSSIIRLTWYKGHPAPKTSLAVMNIT